MKKFIILILFLFCLVFTYSFKPVFYKNFFADSLMLSSGDYSVYCLKIAANLKNVDIIDNGNSFIVKTSLNDAKRVKSEVSQIMGESLSYDSSILGVEKLINLYNIKVVKREQVGNIVSVYGYSNNPNFCNKIEIENNLINVQIAFSNNRVTIGTPIILGDY